MTARQVTSVFDGTTGGSDRSGRRTHIIQLLRDAKTPLSAAEVADAVGIHVNTARFHLESLVDAGLASRESETRLQPGRRRILYSGTLPNQTHERAQGYRLLSQFLVAKIATSHPEMGPDMYEVGSQWGKYLTTRPDPSEVFTSEQLDQKLVEKLDALWFAPELVHGPQPYLVLHNCPFYDSASRSPSVVCQLHVGMLNGSLEELRSSHRVTEILPRERPHLCRALLGPMAGEDTNAVPMVLPEETEHMMDIEAVEEYPDEVNAWASLEAVA